MAEEVPGINTYLIQLLEVCWADFESINIKDTVDCKEKCIGHYIYSKQDEGRSGWGPCRCTVIVLTRNFSRGVVGRWGALNMDRWALHSIFLCVFRASIPLTSAEDSTPPSRKKKKQDISDEVWTSWPTWHEKLRLDDKLLFCLSLRRSDARCRLMSRHGSPELKTHCMPSATVCCHTRAEETTASSTSKNKRREVDDEVHRIERVNILLMNKIKEKLKSLTCFWLVGKIIALCLCAGKLAKAAEEGGACHHCYALVSQSWAPGTPREDVMLNGDRKPRNKEAREASRNQVGYDLDSYQSVLSPRLTCQTHFLGCRFLHQIHWL